MNSEETNEIYFGDVDYPFYDSRRNFLKKLGCGLIIIFNLDSFHVFAGDKGEEPGKRSKPGFNAYLRIREDGRVECYVGKIEMGQGVTTSLALALAEELDVSFDRIDMIMGDTDLCPYDIATWGSMTTRFFDPLLRAAAAEARMELIRLAAVVLKMPEDQLETENGYVFEVADPSNTVSYGALTKGNKIVKTITRPTIFKKSSQYKLVGKSMHNTNARLKVTGEAKYSADIQLPGMLYASISRPPAHGCALLSVNASKAEAIAGVKVVILKDLIAALHPNPNVAMKARDAINVSWGSAPEILANDKTIFKYLVKNVVETNVFEEIGNLWRGFEESDFTIESEYHDGYKAHASIETHTATAYFEGDKLIIWASSQRPFVTREELSKELDMPIEKIHLKQVLIGGSFGGKLYNRQAIETALLARKTGKPVQLAWTRKEEFMYDMFLTAAVIKIKAGVKKDGKISAWKYNLYCANGRGMKDFYGIPNLRTVLYDKVGIHPFGTGSWRADTNNFTTFARESHIDMLSDKIGMDPLTFRLKNISNGKMERTLRLAAKTFGYISAKTGSNKGCGIALGIETGTCVAIIAEVEVNPETGLVKPIRMVCAQDMGQVVNPLGAKVATEGGITMGLGYALFEDIQFDWGEVKTQNFDNYAFARFSVTPSIEAVFIDDMDAPPQGGAEPAIICVGGAISNAVFHASGARVHQLPITPERILAAARK